MQMTMVKLELLFVSGSTEVRTFPTKKEAEWYVHNEGDHVWDYNIKEIDKND